MSSDAVGLAASYMPIHATTPPARARHGHDVRCNRAGRYLLQYKNNQFRLSLHLRFFRYWRKRELSTLILSRRVVHADFVAGLR
jgi:hypothetical protein